MASKTECWLSWFVLMLSFVPGARAEYSIHLAGLVVSCAVAFLLLVVIIAMLVVGFTWNSWFPAIQNSKGRVKMPKAYWKKHEEAKMKLLQGSRKSVLTASTVILPAENGAVNGSATLVSRAKNTGPPKASWVQGWNNANPSDDKAYEELTLEMYLGEEKEEPEFRIETTVVDNETLDLGPFRTTDPSGAEAQVKKDASSEQEATWKTKFTSEQEVTMEMTEEGQGQAFYTSTVGRPRQLSSSQTPPAPPPIDDPQDPAPTNEQTTSFSQFLDSSLVAF